MESTSDPRDILNQYMRWYFSTGVPDACPGEEILAEYVIGTLSSRARETLERHMASCGRCAQTVYQALVVLEDETDTAPASVPEPLVERLYRHIPRPRPRLFLLRWFFRRLIEAIGPLRRRLESLISFHQPALAYVRGRKKAISKNLIVLERAFSEIKLTVEVEKTGPHRADIKIIATRPRSGARFHGVRINLYSGKKELASFVAFRGEALFEQIPFGTYRIVAQDDRSSLATVRLSIKE